MMCESSELETCVNCPADCGTCPVIRTCGEVLSCTFACLDFTADPPMISFTCIADCVSRSCADVQFFINAFFNCALRELITCGDIGCIRRECADEVRACLSFTCPP